MSKTAKFTLHSGFFVSLIIFFFIACVSLGIWQSQRAQQKEKILAAYQARSLQGALKIQDLHNYKDLRFYSLELSGQYDTKHAILLDNKTNQGRIGYELYVPFKVSGYTNIFLIDLGFVPADYSRKILPTIADKPGKVSVHGILNLPPSYFALGSMLEENHVHWPLRVQYIDLSQLSNYYPQAFFPYILQTQSKPLAAEQIVNITPQRHRAYAFQWFALAFTLLVLSALFVRRKNKI